MDLILSFATFLLLQNNYQAALTNYSFLKVKQLQCSELERFTDINENPMQPGGLSQTQKDDLTNQGYIRYTCQTDNIDRIVGYRGPAGEIPPDWMCGDIPVGTVVWKKEFTGGWDIIIESCANPVDPGLGADLQ